MLSCATVHAVLKIMGIELIFEGFWLLVKLLYYQIEATLRFFIKQGRKDVKGEIVLVTGAGSGIGNSI